MKITKLGFLTAAILGTMSQAWAADTTAPTITASTPSGSYTTAQKVVLTVKDNSDTAPKIYYTRDGSVPTTSSTQYKAGQAFTVVDQGKVRDLWIRALAVDKSGNKRFQTFVYYIESAPVVTASKAPGTYSTAQSITLAVKDDVDAAPVVYYTTNGTLPSKSSSKYVAGTKLAISKSTTVRTLSMDAQGHWQRQVFKYVIGVADTVAPIATPTPAAGSYTTAQNVTLALTDAVDTAPVAYYTVDGTTPTTASTKYVAGTKIAISKSATLKVLSKDATGNTRTQSFSYVITPADTLAPVLAVSPAAGSYSSTQSVTLSATDDTDLAPSIYYTTDGTTPTTASTKFTGSAISVADIGVEVDMTIKAIAVDASGNKSAVASYAYSIATTGGDGGSTGTAYDVGLYKTNPNGQKGKSKTITVDGSASDWTADMVIAQGVANDDPRIFRGSHEGPVYDLYSLSAAWDDTNLYLMWQFTNVTDVVDPAQGYPISDNGKPYQGDIPQSVAFDIDSSLGGNGTVADGKGVWGMKHRFTNKEVDQLMMFSSKPGVGVPALFKLNPTTGMFDYGAAYVTNFKTGGIFFKYSDGFAFTKLMGIKKNGYEGYLPADLVDVTKFSDLLTAGHSTKQDTIYEMNIPLAALGITKAQLESKGIGAMVLATFGEDTIGSLPYDPTTLDSATLPYAADASSSAEKNDGDSFTAKFARIGK